MKKRFIPAVLLAIFAALALLGAPSSAFWHGSGSSVIRGMNVNHALTQIYEGSGGSSFGRGMRVRLKSPTRITSIKFVYATFWQAGNTSTGLFDQEWPAPFNVIAAVEYPYTAAKTGIPAGRTNALFGGSSVYAYGGTGSNPSGVEVSDNLAPPGGIPANTYFGIWSYVEPPLSQPQTYAITALSSSGTTATATMADTTGLYVNEITNVTGASVTGYNNQFSAILAVTPTTITYKTAASNLAAATTATAIPQFLPANAVASGAVERYNGTIAVTSAAGSQIASNWVSTATSVTALTSLAAGQNIGYLPAALLIDYASGDKVVLNLGDSTEFGVSSGAATNVIGRDGDVMGQPDGGISWVDQGVYYNNGLNYVNMGKGGDGAKWLHDPATWPLRRNLILQINPTHVINGMAFNDQGLTSSTWTATNSSFVRGTAVLHSGNAYIELTNAPCTTGSTGPIGTTIGTPETDGTCSWAYVGAETSTNVGAQGLGWNMVLNDQIKALLPGIPIYNTTMMPNATYGANMTTLADQTTTVAAVTTRNNFNNGMKALQWIMGWTAVFDQNLYIENDPIAGDSKWVVDNVTPNLATNGAHPNSNGYRLGSQAITAGSFNFLLKRDIDPASNDNDPMWLEKAT